MRYERQDCAQRWGADNILRHDPDSLAWIARPVRQILCSVCLPRKIGAVFSATPVTRQNVPGIGQAVAIGLAWHQEYSICVAIDSGQVYAVRPDNSEATFVNSGLGQFGDFLWEASLIDRLFTVVESGDMSRSDYLSEAEHSRMRLRDCDAVALEKGNWWSGIVEEFRMI